MLGTEDIKLKHGSLPNLEKLTLGENGRERSSDGISIIQRKLWW